MKGEKFNKQRNAIGVQICKDHKELKKLERKIQRDDVNIKREKDYLNKDAETIKIFENRLHLIETNDPEMEKIL
jgi:hypothetical protein